MKAHNSPSEFSFTEPVHVEYRIDYLQFSTSSGIIGWETSGRAIKSRLPYYSYCIEFDSGMLKYHGNPNTDKTLYILSGQACANLEINPESCAYVQNLPAVNATRLDLCMTVNQFILHRVLESDPFIFFPVITPRIAPEITVISGRDKRPQTVYIGNMKKRARKGIVRAYDKALQLGIPGPLNRVEVEFRQRDAAKAVKALANGYSIAQTMNQKFTIRTEWYEYLMGQAPSACEMFYQEQKNLKEPVVERKARWLKTQVVPSLAYLAWYDWKFQTSYLDEINRLVARHAEKIRKLNS